MQENQTEKGGSGARNIGEEGGRDGRDKCVLIRGQTLVMVRAFVNVAVIMVRGVAVPVGGVNPIGGLVDPIGNVDLGGRGNGAGGRFFSVGHQSARSRSLLPTTSSWQEHARYICSQTDTAATNNWSDRRRFV